MRKADSLRDWLEACLPELKRHPDRLQIYIDAGSVKARHGRSLSFAYTYTLSVLLTDYAGNPDQVVVPLLAWIEREQPDLLKREDSQPFRFESEILDRSRVDLLFQIDLIDPVIVTPREDGSGVDVSPPPPPPSDAFPGIGVSWLWQCYGGTELLAQTNDPTADLKPGVPPEVGP